MVKKSSDLISTDPRHHANNNERRDAAVFVVATDKAFLDEVVAECPDLPGAHARYASLDELSEALTQFQRINLAFVVIAERTGRDIDIAALRNLRLEYPQLTLTAVLEECDQQSSLRLQSVGVHNILLPPFSEIDLAREIATALPNVPSFKRHPDLMRRGQLRLDFLIPSDLSYVLGLNHTISMLLKEFGYPPQDTRVNLPLACDEALTNAIVHGNKCATDKKVNIQLYISHTRFRMRVRDQGDGFDVDEVADPREGENVLRSGGRGVFLMRNIMDSVEYKDGGRVLELEKLNPDAKE